MTTNGSNGNGNGDGSLSPRGRFDRMENTLDRIEEKLDLKADATTTADHEKRLRDVEKWVQNRQGQIMLIWAALGIIGAVLGARIAHFIP